MIDLYTWTTPNGRKISIALEEMGLLYTVHTINLQKEEQFAPDFLKISPNNKIPAIIDHDTGTSVFESSAILTYLAEKSGQFIPTSQPDRVKVQEWLAWQTAGLGPMLGQLNHFLNVADEKLPYAINRFSEEMTRLLGVLDRQLAEHEYVAGDYSIADMAIYPWSSAAYDAASALIENSFKNLEAWHVVMAARPAVQAGMSVPEV